MTTDGLDDEPREGEDHDLMTFEETVIRLRHEIDHTRQLLADAPSPETRAALAARLSVLEDTLERNTRSAVDHPGEEGFLLYEPPPTAH